MNSLQALLFEVESKSRFPTTRYQGSKMKYVNWIWNFIKEIEFETALDAFGGTGSVSYKLKQEGKELVYNDVLKFNSIIGSALIENCEEKITESDLELILKTDPQMQYPTFIQDTFQDIYYTNSENQWLDIVIKNITKLESEYKKSVALFALFQACIIKRPYNLFHRKNLYIRESEVERSFGNKSSWDTPFEIHFRNFIKEANTAVFSNGKDNIALNQNVFDISNTFDLIYIDTPYISEKGVGTDYLDFYHFLEGVVQYDHWNELIDYKSKHKRLKVNRSAWTDPKLIDDAFVRLINQFKESVLVISYRSDGIPTVKRLVEILRDHGKMVTVHESSDMKYVLSNKKSSEILLIAR